ncbi:Flp pilus assembly protein TadB [Bartonella callosciuri]|uniref:Flp pilus assembly protein TadB n=1 Tax=Bartonella callosciuri TaxID=686223 RepID=A0A840NRJ1_9HYPH|nr:hypothetical protein [Bartonella callosciuri]MBB5074460.1 Flp pilus assembly protein TadB [Bartonella callosciuri]
MPFFLSFGIEGAKLLNNGMDIQQMIASGPVLFTVYVITTALVILVMVYVAFSLPVILILYWILNQRVKKMIKRLEKFI